jgi:hypothetical protein
MDILRRQAPACYKIRALRNRNALKYRPLALPANRLFRYKHSSLFVVTNTTLFAVTNTLAYLQLETL